MLIPRETKIFQEVRGHRAYSYRNLYSVCDFRGGVSPSGSILVTNSVKEHICDVINSRLGHVLPTSVNGIDFATSLPEFTVYHSQM